LWHANHDLDPPALARLLRDPPLQTATVVCYILDAIRLGKLPYQKGRLRTEVLGLVPKQLLHLRYRSLVKACEDGQHGKASADDKAEG